MNNGEYWLAHTGPLDAKMTATPDEEEEADESDEFAAIKTWEDLKTRSKLEGMLAVLKSENAQAWQTWAPWWP